MFELLLQADKSMSDGLLDQAERTYWQLIELDPTNAIAVAGLARISLQRGDQRLARTFADRALGIDPDSIAARRVIDSLDQGGADAAGPGQSDLTLGAERLEALSRRRTGASEADESAEGAGPTGRRKGASRKGAAAAAASAGPGAATGPGKGPAASKGARGRVRPDQFGPLPSEPLPDRRQAGRLAAAAAAAAAAAREPTHSRHQHRAMPSGRRRFEPGQLKAPALDPFSAAEMAAAVAAVDAMEDSADTPNPGSRTEPSSEPAAGAVAGANATLAGAALTLEDLSVGKDPAGAASVMAAIDATEADESVALRLALLSDAAELADRTPESPAEQSGEDAGDAAGSTADEARADAGARFKGALSEEDAEAQALREAVALVMKGPAAGQAGSAAPSLTSKGSRPAQGETTTKHDAAASERTPAESEAGSTGEGGASPRKKGLFRRLRGS